MKLYMKEGNNQSINKEDIEKKSLTEKYRGLGKRVWEKLGEADEYLKTERETWKRES